jgi:hypothetical protein
MGALFLWGWLGRPGFAFLPPSVLGLPCKFVPINYDNNFESGFLNGNAGDGFAYRASLSRNTEFLPCAAGSLEEFVMEQYTGFFIRRGDARVFRAWHPRWLQAPVRVESLDIGMVLEKFPWFKNATFAGATFAPGFSGVLLGRAHRLPVPWSRNDGPACAGRNGWDELETNSVATNCHFI